MVIKLSGSIQNDDVRSDNFTMITEKHASLGSASVGVSQNKTIFKFPSRFKSVCYRGKKIMFSVKSLFYFISFFQIYNYFFYC